MILKKNKLKALAGDASSRKFFRKFCDDKKSKVKVVSKKEKFKNLILYAAINNFLNLGTATYRRLLTSSWIVLIFQHPIHQLKMQ